VTLEEVLHHFQTLERDPLRPDRLSVLLDLSEEESLPKTNELYSVVHEIGRIRDNVVFDACAILAPRDALFGMMRMFEMLAEGLFRVTGTFRSADAAEAWLISQSASSDKKPASDKDEREA
jgi:hypothetical protein